MTRERDRSAVHRSLLNSDALVVPPQAGIDINLLITDTYVLSRREEEEEKEKKKRENKERRSLSARIADQRSCVCVRVFDSYRDDYQ